MNKFQFRVVVWDLHDNIIQDTIQEIPIDNKYHLSKVVEDKLKK